MRWGILLGAVVVLGHLGASALPDEEPLSRAIAAYDRGRLDEAIALLEKALVTLQEPRARARALLYAGLAQAERNRPQEARKSFLLALTEDAEISPDRERVPPAVLAQFDAVRMSLQGELLVEASEPGARIFVAGTEVGRTPHVLRMPVGWHEVRLVSADGYRVAETRRLLVRAAERGRYVARLEALYGRMEVDLQPPGAQVFEGNRLIATAPTSAVSVRAGEHRYLVRCPGFADVSADVRVEPNRTVTLRARLTERPTPWYAKRRSWGFISFGLAGGALLTAFLGAKSGRSNEQEIINGLSAGTLTFERYKQELAAAESSYRWSNALFGVGGAASLAGILLVFTDRERPRPLLGRWQIVPGVGQIALARSF
jgi:tetratricopeptide (TPR) repeat protein